VRWNARNFLIPRSRLSAQSILERRRRAALEETALFLSAIMRACELGTGITQVDTVPSAAAKAGTLSTGGVAVIQRAAYLSMAFFAHA